MKTATVFFCDIIGTFKGKTGDEDIDYSELMSFIKFLEDLIENDNSDKLIFSFITSDNIDLVLKESEFFRSYLNNTHINLGRQYFEDGYIEDGLIYKAPKTKPQQILEYIEDLKNEYVISMIYYADDAQHNHTILEALFNDPFESFIPQKRIGVPELNELFSKRKNKNVTLK